MANTIVLVLFSGLLCVRGAQDKDRCHEVSTINCDTHYVPDGDERVCSSDFEDCPTLCHFAQKKCKEPHLTILGLGPCSLVTSQITSDPIDTTTSDPVSTTITPDPAVDPIRTTVDTTVDQTTTTTDDPPVDRTVTTDDPQHSILSTILKVLHTLKTTTIPTFPSSTLPQHANCTDVICTVFCSHADKITCPTDLDPLCGNDGKFYTNDCVFAKAKCKENNLVKQDLVLCKTDRRHRRELEFV